MSFKSIKLAAALDADNDDGIFSKTGIPFPGFGLDGLIFTLVCGEIDDAEEVAAEPTDDTKPFIKSYLNFISNLKQLNTKFILAGCWR